MSNRETFGNGVSTVVLAVAAIIVGYVAVVVVLLRFGRFDKVWHTGPKSAVVGIVWKKYKVNHLAQEFT